MMQDNSEKLIQAYNRMLERLKAGLEQAHERARQDILPNLQRQLDTATNKAIELGELTRDEAERVAAYLKRDLHHAAQHARETGKELADWLRFDLQLVEARFAERLAWVVDRVRLELDKLAPRAKQPEGKQTEWHTGEVAGVGTLTCDKCGQELHFHATGHIPPCPKCHGTRFRRGAAAS